MSFIEFKNICKMYPGSKVNTVDDFNLNIEEKEFVAFVGPSGCGKSTTLRMIAGFEEITGGELYIDGKKVNEMTMADRIVIMKEGVIQQVGKPMELYDHPKNQFVAGFIGSPQMNFFDVTVENKVVTFADGNKITLPENVLQLLKGHEGSMTLGIRGEDIKTEDRYLEQYRENIQHAVITDTEVMGNENNLYFQFGGTQAVARVSKYEVAQVGDTIDFVFMPEKLHFFDKETGINYTEE